ncbi:PEST proteolytic signal-containing nuclear protein isoform X2 [Gopherus flavomarginatus]|uniref:PEST proteolytic signal-containing nuclear protein isoform X2 n=1 Tax=Gopherus flavomarginatus TaxID=286002 RepID=UPI0021CBDF01|nr:PEST proteolytic signal-containing nuclear protein isoform X2 [Gopherus flavomarginatus]
MCVGGKGPVSGCSEPGRLPRCWAPSPWGSRGAASGSGWLQRGGPRVIGRLGQETSWTGCLYDLENMAGNYSNGGESSSRSAEKRLADEEAEDFTTKPAPAKMSKFGFAIGSQTTKKAPVISIKLGANKPKEPAPTLAPKTLSVAAVFNEDDDSEPEEMPPEAKMRMKNIGRDTPTSAGPNSFNKGKHGFSDNQKLWERNIKSHLGNVPEDDD